MPTKPYRPHYTMTDVDRELEALVFPDEFHFGASTAGYQVEGGFNGKGEPKNNWYWAEETGIKERTGRCCAFFERYAEDLDRAAWIGLDVFRLGIEWARLQPATDPETKEPPEFSETAARAYANILAACLDRGMTPLVTLHHFTHPLWAGLDFWTDAGKVRELFPQYVEFAVTAINRALIADHGKPPLPYFLTVNEPFMVPESTYVYGEFPGGGARGWPAAVAAYENLLIGHVLAARTVRRVYAENGWPRPAVTTNGWCAAIYGMDKLVQDLLLAPASGIARDAVAGHLAAQRRRFNARMRSVPHVQGPAALKRAYDVYRDESLWRWLGDEPLKRVSDLLYDGDADTLDAVSFDYYDPFPGNGVDFEWPRIVRVRSECWEWNVNPPALGAFLAAYSWTAGDKPLHLVENGMAYRGVGGVGHPREDGARRDDVLRAMFYEIVHALNRGVRLTTYCYWSLIDNYEWGSFAPRFGLFGIDREKDLARLPTDIAGHNAAGAYRLLVQAFRDRDKRALRAAFAPRRVPRYGT
jgi:beta-glucosidase/6-phospho-beta-glucosidase/beta-galactosidase